jgi:hypothetical protein
MQTFYERLKAGAGRAEALTAARASVRSRTEDPYFWAPFVLFGDTGPLARLAQGPTPPPLGEDAESRLTRAMLLKRLRHSLNKLGDVSWTSAGTTQTALDTDIQRNGPGAHPPLTMTLLSKSQLVTLVARDYQGPGHYAVADAALSATLGPVNDPLAVDLRKQSALGGAARAVSGELTVREDSPEGGLHGTFRLSFAGANELIGRFDMESSLPDLPEVMRPH